MKGCLVIVGFLLVFVVVSASILWGVAVHVERAVEAKRVPLTRAASSIEIVDREPETRGGGSGGRRRTGGSRIEGSVITYVYEVGGRRFRSSDWFSYAERDPGVRVPVVCVDPDDPAVHTVRFDKGAVCGSADRGSDGVRRADSVRS